MDVEKERKYKETLKKASERIKALTAENESLRQFEPIAVVGMGCRFPGHAWSPQEFWQVLGQGRDTVTDIPSNRWEVDTYYDPDWEAPGKMYTRQGAFLSKIESFDPAFFGITPQEAKAIDPQQRILLEVSWETFEQAGLNPDRLRGSQTGVFIGLSNYDYIQAHIHSGDVERITPYSGSGVMFSTAAGRLSYFYDFQGPCLTVDTACSSSLVSVDLAMKHLQKGQCDYALAGGVNLILSLESFIAMCKVKALSPDGRCRAFDNQAKGYGRGEGCGLILLKRLSDALRDRDRILSVIRGSAVNHDGCSNGLTAPNGPSQQRVIQQALKEARLRPEEVDYVEAHGTGTILGDPIEVHALDSVYGKSREANRPLYIGSVKTNIGHTEASAGIASIIKVVLSLQQKKIPPSLHFVEPNQHIAFDRIPVQVTTKLQDWNGKGKKRTAGISAFGLSGTNAHILMEEAPEMPEPEQGDDPRDYHLLKISAQSKQAIKDLVHRYYDHLAQNPDIRLMDFCYSANTGRQDLYQRLAVGGQSPYEVISALQAYLQEEESLNLFTAKQRLSSKDIVFLFTGQKNLYAGMGKALLIHHPVFEKALKQCQEILSPYWKESLTDLIYRDEEAGLNETQTGQPVLVAFEYALAKLWEHWGVFPDAVLGHGIGEYTAAIVAGVMSLESGLRMAVKRGKGMQASPDGWLMPLEGFKQAKEQEQRLEPSIPFYSTVTGNRIGAKELIPSHYWEDQMSQPVLFDQAVNKAYQDGYRIFLGLGSTEGLAPFASQTCPEGLFLSSLKKGASDWQSIYFCAAELYVHGIDLDWPAFEAPFPYKQIDVPSYPFQRKPYWMDLCPVRKQDQGKGHPLSGDRPGDLETSHAEKDPELQNQSEASMNIQKTLLKELTDKLAEVGGFDPQDISPDDSLMELGLDSLMLVRMGQEVEKRFQVELSMQQFFQELHSLQRLVEYVMEHGDLRGITDFEPSEPENSETGTTISQTTWQAQIDSSEANEQPDSIVQLMRQQLQLMEQATRQDRQSIEKIIQDQLMILQKRDKNCHCPESTTQVSTNIPDQQKKPEKKRQRAGSAEQFRSLNLKQSGVLTEEQKGFVEDLIQRHVQLTPASKSMTQDSRPVLADWKNTLSYWNQLKEAKYPIVSSQSKGPRIWDVDGNEYIDVAMGMGVHFLGHTPPAIKESLKGQLNEGMEVGTQCDLTGEVARLITELTGNERVTFCNTGSEAVMVCLRLARAVSQRDKIVIFKGSYHGIFDGVLAMNEGGQQIPIGLGTPQGMIQDVIVLEYDSPDSLQFIQEHADELAGVLVEPVQSRNPDLQPQSFLKKLRRITSQEDIALIFDEMINGFRIHPGGAQHWFGVQADICAYGKIVGGGLPIGVVAGKSKYMDYIDGGVWDYGDQSRPNSAMIFFGGTFARNPMTMASAYAALLELKRQGPALQQAVNRRTQYFCDRLNYWLEQELVPMRVQSFASQWRLVPVGNSQRQPLEMELLFLQLMIKGVYTWERRICFFSAAHGQEEIDYVLESIKESISELRQHGFPFAMDSSEMPRRFVSPTSIQRRLYALCQRSGGEKPYHLPYAYWVDGRLDVDRLEECMQEIILRHETLRTSFHELDGDVVLRLDPQPRFLIERYEAEEGEISEVVERFIRPFDLKTAPLLRMAVIQVGPQRHVLLSDAHHIVIDGLSFNYVVRDLIDLYEGRIPQPVKHTFLECAALLENSWQARQEELDAFWDQELQGPLPSLELPGDFPRPKEPVYEGDHLYSRIESESLYMLKEFAGQRGVSLYMLLVAAYTAFLHRLTGQEDILVGTPVAGRDCPEARETVGMFVNTTVIRNYPKAKMPFGSFLEEVKDTCTRVYDHQDYPFERMADRYNTGRPQNRNAIFDTTLTYENGNDRIFQMQDLNFSQYPIHDRASMFDFRLEVIEEKDVLHLDFQYNTDLFARQTIERWIAYFNRLLLEIVRDFSSPIGAIDILPESEKEWLKKCNQTRTAYPQDSTIVDLFMEQAGKTPDRPAVVFKETRLTYQELDRRSNQIAQALQAECSISPGDKVGVFLERSEWVICAFLSILKAGGVYVPLDTEYPRDRLGFMIRDSDCSVVLTQQGLSPLLPEDVQVRAKDIQSFSADKGSAVHTAIPVDHPAYVIYTSGSTGQPKGCLVTHQNVVRLIKNNDHDFDFDQTDVWSGLHSFCFDFSVWEMYGALLYGGCLAIADKKTVQDPNRLLQFLRRHRVTVLNQTPPSFQNLMDREYRESEHHLDDHLRYVIFGGDRLSPASLKPWLDLYSLSRISLVNMYGITETTVHVSFYPILAEDIQRSSGQSPIGRPIPETRVYVCNEMMMEQPIGVAGEMYIGGSGVCQGYLNRQELNLERFVDSPWGEGKIYRSGDLARRLPNGNLLYLGRNDQQVQIRGHRIEPDEIQIHLQNYPAVKKALVTTREIRQDHPELVAYCIAKTSITGQQLRNFLARRIPAYMIPAYFIFMDEFPLTSNGKIDRKSLPDPKVADIENKTGFVAPRDALEETMAAIWSDVLGIEHVGVEDNYFAIGGDSIKAIQIISRLYQLGLELEVRHILEAQTIGRLRQYVKQSQTSSIAKSHFGLAEGEFQTLLRYLEVKSDDIETVLPLSSMQEGILYHTIADQDSSTYFEQFTYRIRGELDLQAFEQSWNELAKRHSVLRTAIVFEQVKEPVQVVLQSRFVPFFYHDWRQESDQVKEKKIKDFQQQDRAYGFDLSHEPLMRISALHIKDNVYEIVWSHHHIIMDGWSMSILIEEFIQIYKDLLAERRPQLPCPPSYSDYIEWLWSQDKEEGLAYWEQFLRGYEALVSVPKTRQQSQSHAYQLKEHVFYLDASVTQGLLQLAKESQVTLNTVLQTVWACLLGKINEANDVVFGVVVSGRPPQLNGVERMVGLFLQSFPLRVNWQDRTGFCDLLQQVQGSFTECQSHHVCSMAEILSLTPHKHDLLDHLFVFENYPMTEVDWSESLGFGIEDVRGFEQTNYDFGLVIHPGDEIEVKFTFNANAHTSEQIQDLERQFQYFVQQVLGHKRTAISDISMEEIPQKQVVMEEMDPLSWWRRDLTVLDLFEIQASKTPDAIAVEDSKGTMTYAQLDREANALANSLHKANVGRGCPVGIYMGNCSKYVVSMLAVQKAGGLFVPVDPSTPGQRLKRIFQKIESPVWITRSQHLQALRSWPDDWQASLQPEDIFWSDESNMWRHLSMKNGQRETLIPLTQAGLDERPEPTDSMYIMFTSGSTGEPKAILGGHDGLSHFLQWQSHEFGLDESIRTSNLSPVMFDVSLRDIYLPLISGGRVVIPDPETRSDLWQLIDWLIEKKISLVHIVPSLYRLLLNELEAVSWPKGSFQNLGTILLAGEAVYEKDIQQGRSLLGDHVEFVNLYGPSETTLAKLFHRVSNLSQESRRGVPLGKAIDGARAFIVKNNQEAETGEIGEIYIQTPFACRGYYRDPERTKECFVTHPLEEDSIYPVYKTGDLGRLTEEGQIEFIGRVDGQVKINGVRVELEEVDRVLGLESGIDQSVVMAHSRNNGENALVAYYTEKEPVKEEALRTRLQEYLPAAMIPDFFVRMDEFPYSLNGKIDRRALPKPDDLIYEREEYEPPQNEIEKQLVDIWRQVLGIEKIGVNSPFLNIGGNSLKAIRAISWINREFQSSIRIRTFFELATIRKIAQAIISKESKTTDIIEPLPKSHDYPLSHAQRRLWILQQLNMDARAYNLPFAWLLEGDFDVDAFGQAMQMVVDRHESLRTTFHQIGSQPRQVVHDHVPFEVGQVDLRMEIDPFEGAKKRIRQEAHKPFYLSEAPLIRVILYQIGDKSFVLFANIHHIVFDGTSAGVIIQDILQFYQSLIKKEEPWLPSLPIQYKDFAAWQNTCLAQGSMQEHRHYWQTKLSGALPLIDLQTDYLRPPMQTFEGETLSFDLDQSLLAWFREYCHARGGSLYMGVVALVKTLLYRYTGQRDILVGTVIAGRDHAQLDDQVGFYVNTLVLRDLIDPELKFDKNFDSIKQTVSEAIEHREYPFDKIVDDLGLDRDMSRPPLTEVMVVYQNMDQGDFAIEDVEISELDLDFQSSKFPLSFVFEEQDDGSVSLKVEYNTDLFKQKRMEHMAAHLQELIRSIKSQPEQPLRSLNVLPELERERLIHGLNNTACDLPEDKTLLDLFEEQVRQRPEASAVVSESIDWTYRELKAKANHLAHRLISDHKLIPGQHVGVLISRSPWLPVAFLGIQKAGAVYVPIDPSYPYERVSFMLKDCMASIVLTDTKGYTEWGDGIKNCIDISILDYDDPGNPDIDRAGSDVAYVIYTSGSTGRPKGVLIENQGIVNLSLAQRNELQIEPADRILQFAPSSFDASLSEIIMALGQGASLIVVGEDLIFDQKRFAQYLQEKKVTIAILPPSYVAGLPPESFSPLRLLITAGEAAQREDALVLSQSVEYVNAYGPTESTIWATSHRIDPQAKYQGTIPIGRPIQNIEIFVLDEQGQPRPMGYPGEIYIGGVGVARGYLNRETLTEERFIPHPFRPGQRVYRTGDIGFWTWDGQIEFLGRMDHQVKIRGQRIELGEIEQCLQHYPGLERVVVDAWKEEGTKYLTAYLVDHNSLNVNSLREHAKSYLPDFMVPHYWVSLDSIPMLPNGKVDRNQLPSPKEQALDSAKDYVAPVTDEQKCLSQVWSRVLGLERVGIYDRFFDLGGDSIKAIQIVALLQEEGYSLNVKEIFRSPTIESLALKMTESRQSDSTQITTEPIPFTPIQHWFFEEHDHDLHHFNQSVLLKPKHSLQEQALRRSLMALVNYHDGLRLRFPLEEGQRLQRYGQRDQDFELIVIDLSSTSNFEEALQDHAQSVQESMDLEQGPLFKAVLYRCPGKERLLLVAHHLVVDGVTWRILLEDLVTAYHLAVEGKKIHFPPKDASYQQWAEILQSYSQSSSIKKEIPYWKEVDKMAGMMIPVDTQAEDNRYGDSEAVSFALTAEETNDLLYRSHYAYNTELNDLLLTALAKALKDWVNEDSCLIALEGHGREAIDENTRVYRTAGWFTSIYPFALPLKSLDIGSHIKEVKEAIRRIPQKGIGYGILKSLTPDSLKQDLKCLARPQIAFNYLGQFDQVSDRQLLSPAFESMGRAEGPDLERTYLLEWDGYILNGQLKFSLRYNRKWHFAETISDLLNRFEQALKTILAHCLDQEESELTPSDVARVAMNLDDFEQLFQNE